MSPPVDRPLRILHAVRPPVGGIFRHILDLANGQAARGHQVGIIADSLTGGERADKAFAEIAPRLKLGVHRLPIHREPWPSDFRVWFHFMRMIRAMRSGVDGWVAIMSGRSADGAPEIDADNALHSPSAVRKRAAA